MPSPAARRRPRSSRREHRHRTPPRRIVAYGATANVVPIVRSASATRGAASSCAPARHPVVHDDRRPELLDHVVGAGRRLDAAGAAREVVALRPGGGDRVGLGGQLVHDDEPFVRGRRERDLVHVPWRGRERERTPADGRATPSAQRSGSAGPAPRRRPGGSPPRPPRVPASRSAWPRDPAEGWRPSRRSPRGPARVRRPARAARGTNRPPARRHPGGHDIERPPSRCRWRWWTDCPASPPTFVTSR